MALKHLPDECSPVERRIREALWHVLPRCTATRWFHFEWGFIAIHSPVTWRIGRSVTSTNRRWQIGPIQVMVYGREERDTLKRLKQVAWEMLKRDV